MLVHPIEDALEKPYSMPPNATVESAMDGTSRCGRFRFPNVIEQEHGTGKRSKGQWHDAAQACAPPVRVDDGPAYDGSDRQGPADITMPAIPMAVPRFSTGNTSIGTTDTNGSSTPDAAACSTRPADQHGETSGAAAQSSGSSEQTHQRCGKEQLDGW